MLLPFVPAIIETPYIFHLWLKNVPEFSILFTRFLLIKKLIELLFYPVSVSITAHGNIKKFQIITSFFYFISLFFVYYAFKIGYPVYSLYIVLLILEMGIAITISFFAWRNFNFSVVKFFKQAIFKCLFIFLITFLASYIPIFIFQESFYRVLIVLTVSTTTILITSWLVSFDEDEKSLVKRNLMLLYNKISKT